MIDQLVQRPLYLELGNQGSNPLMLFITKITFKELYPNNLNEGNQKPSQNQLGRPYDSFYALCAIR